MIDWNEILMIVLKAVITVALPVLLKLLFDWLKLQKLKFEQNLDAETRYIIEEAVRLAVLAAEQSGLAGLLGEKYKDKKSFALAAAEKFLAQYGITIDLDVLAALIEAAVMEEFHQENKTLRARAARIG